MGPDSWKRVTCIVSHLNGFVQNLPLLRYGIFVVQRLLFKGIIRNRFYFLLFLLEEFFFIFKDSFEMVLHEQQ